MTFKPDPIFTRILSLPVKILSDESFMGNFENIFSAPGILKSDDPTFCEGFQLG